MSERGRRNDPDPAARVRDGSRSTAREDALSLTDILSRLLADEKGSLGGRQINEMLRSSRPPVDDDPMDAIERLIHRVEAVEARSTLAISGIDQSVVGLLKRLERADQATSELGTHVDGLVEDVTDTHNTLKDAIARIEADDSAARNLEGLRALEAAVAKLADHVYQESSANQSEADAIKGRVEAGFSDLNDRVEGIEASVSTRLRDAGASFEKAIESAELRSEGAARHLADRFTGLEQSVSARLATTQAALADNDALKARVEAVESGIETSTTAMNTALAAMQSRLQAAEDDTNKALSRLEQTLSALDARIVSVADRSAQQGEDSREQMQALKTSLETRFEGIAHELRTSIDRTRSDLADQIQSAADAAKPEVFATIQDNIDGIRVALDAVSQRQDQADSDLSAQIAAASGAPSPEAMKGVEDRIDQFSAAVEQRLAYVEAGVSGMGDVNVLAVQEDLATLSADVSTRIEGIETRETEIVSRLGDELSRLSEKVDSRIQESEQNSANAIEQLGLTVSHVSRRIEARQAEALTTMDSKLSQAQALQDTRLNDALVRVSRKLQEIQSVTRESVSPMQRAIASLATRMDTLEAFTTPPFAEGAGTTTEPASQASAESGRGGPLRPFVDASDADPPPATDETIGNSVDNTVFPPAEPRWDNMTSARTMTGSDVGSPGTPDAHGTEAAAPDDGSESAPEQAQDQPAHRPEISGVSADAVESEDLYSEIPAIGEGTPSEETGDALMASGDDDLFEDGDGNDLAASSAAGDMLAAELDPTSDDEDFDANGYGDEGWSEQAETFGDDDIEAADTAHSHDGPHGDTYDYPEDFEDGFGFGSNDEATADPEGDDSDFEEGFDPISALDNSDNASTESQVGGVDAGHATDETPTDLFAENAMPRDIPRPTLTDPELASQALAGTDEGGGSQDYIARARAAAKAAAEQEGSANGDQLPSRSRVPLFAAASVVAMAATGTAGYLFLRGKQPPPAPTLASPQSTQDQATSGERGLAMAALLSPSADADQRVGNDDADLETVLFDPSVAEPSSETGPAPPREAPRTLDLMSAQTEGVVRYAPVPAGRSLLAAAQSGDPVAELTYGQELISDGAYADGVRLVRAAAQDGLSAAQYRLAKLHEKGLGVPRDIVAARQWTEKAAAGQNIKAMHDLAVFYAEGEGGVQSYAKAAEWFGKAAAHGVVDSQYNLAVLYERGLGVTENLPEAAFWFAVAEGQGDSGAGARLITLRDKLGSADVQNARRRAGVWEAAPLDARANGDFGQTSWGFGAPNQVRGVQSALIALGYADVSATGDLDTATARAIADYEGENGLSQTGRITPELIDALNDGATIAS